MAILWSLGWSVYVSGIYWYILGLKPISESISKSQGLFQGPRCQSLLLGASPSAIGYLEMFLRKCNIIVTWNEINRYGTVTKSCTYSLLPKVLWHSAKKSYVAESELSIGNQPTVNGLSTRLRNRRSSVTSKNQSHGHAARGLAGGCNRRS